MRSMFFCIDGHTAGNPVRLVAGGAPFLEGRTMSERRGDFQRRFDWIRRGLMFEPRGHDMMSGGFVMPPLASGHDALGASALLRLSPLVRQRVRAIYEPVHPLDPTIRCVSHVMWTDWPLSPGAHARNAVFYGERAIDRSPCGTGSSARMARLAARGELRPGDTFVHESIIGSCLTGRVLEALEFAGTAAIIPANEGSAWATGYNTLWIDPRQPFPAGFQVT